jgi:hypothetical protein
MKKVLLSSLAMLCAFLSFSQLQEDFDPAPSGWILSQGANFQTVSGNGAIVTPAVGGNNPTKIGTPVVAKTSNTFEICVSVTAYTANLNSAVSFPCNSYMDVLFVRSSVTNANDAALPENILGRIDNYLLPSGGGNTCFTFSFPGSVTAADFKVFLSFHAACNQGGIRYVIDNVSISGANLICGGVNCPPGVSSDVFNRPMGEASFNAVLYGTPIDPSYPALPPGYTADASGTDGDQDDAYPHLTWQLVTGPTAGTVIIYNDGTATISRNSSSITTLTFTYRVCDDGPDNNPLTTADNMCSSPTTVTVNWAPGNLMPVTFTYFAGARNRNNVTLKWETATESANTGFEILRNTDNGGFSKVGFVSTKAVDGNSNNRISYEFTDVNTSKGVTLYRLRQIDANGKSQLSQIVTVKGEGVKSSITVFPTPSTTGDVTVSVSGYEAYDAYLVDMTGRILKEYKRPATQNIKMSNLQSGMYVVKIVDLKTGEQSSEKIVVNKR